jgi:hypothetical protein
VLVSARASRLQNDERHGLAAHGAFKTADLASLFNVLAAVINRAAFTELTTGF